MPANDDGPGQVRELHWDHFPPSNFLKSKSRRVEQACIRCRSRKAKCNGSRPSCSGCRGANAACIYASPPRKRGLTGGYVRVLETLWGSILERIDGSEHAAIKLLEELVVDRGEEWRMEVLEKWKNSRLLREVNRQLSIWDTPEERVQSQEGKTNAQTKQDGASSLQNPPIFQWRVPEETHVEKDRASSSPAEVITVGTSSTLDYLQSHRSEANQNTKYQKIHSMTVASPLLPYHTSDRHPEGVLTLPDNTWELLNRYFTYTHTWFPILEKSDIYKTAQQYPCPRDQIYEHTAQTGAHAALWAALTLAQLQDVAMPFDPPDIVPAERHGKADTEAYRTARTLIPDEDYPCDLGHVQSLLLLSLASCKAGAWERAWHSAGRALRAAYEVRSKTRNEGYATSLNLCGRQKHVLMGAFILDTVISARVQRPAHVRCHDMADAGLVLEDGIEEWGPWVDISTCRGPNDSNMNQHQPLRVASVFNRLFELSCILHDLANDGQGKDDVPKTYPSLVQILRKWLTSLPKVCTVTGLEDHQSQAPPLLPHVLNLHLLFTAIVAQLEVKTMTFYLWQDLVDPTSMPDLDTPPAQISLLKRMYVERYTESHLFPLIDFATSRALLHLTASQSLSDPRQAAGDILVADPNRRHRSSAGLTHHCSGRRLDDSLELGTFPANETVFEDPVQEEGTGGVTRYPWGPRVRCVGPDFAAALSLGQGGAAHSWSTQAGVQSALNRPAGDEVGKGLAPTTTIGPMTVTDDFGIGPALLGGAVSSECMDYFCDQLAELDDFVW
ncbi:hypothetical protein A1O3_01900 [Capronia epimyces CBS 606.96]|uniref:Zn(2)-C6 fungal-type domain-containing protein n=1 Tax=Capronia epimyces CBS 606.96 TaxID=1182542 RepID=W9YHX8_9EURO|nr:uncharacterized protein A1O3_01900 [Capronia epimyces CBS 606.96]EXJ88836.1 hypothetical protein A1O3_01900 [Capronia epimyces CBS 606.96]